MDGRGGFKILSGHKNGNGFSCQQCPSSAEYIWLLSVAGWHQWCAFGHDGWCPFDGVADGGGIGTGGPLIGPRGRRKHGDGGRGRAGAFSYPRPSRCAALHADQAVEPQVRAGRGFGF